MVWIHKGGSEGNPLNYRPISLSQTLPRIFMKIVHSELRPLWDLIHGKQFGFRKDIGTRIAVLNFLKVYGEAREKYPENESWIITIDIAKCYDSVQHILLLESVKRFVDINLIKNFLLEYYCDGEIGLYQGDPISPILFAFLSHFLILKLEPKVYQLQMFADDLIILAFGNIHEVRAQIRGLYNIIREFGTKVNAGKTTITKNLREVKYLGI